ncbi:hypothetical protein GH714_036541 [Hevea brasiliensis]|uniref:Bromo domain-containing protein n=1 Tax=Hevea brasiliensis TaxID=3981 RepID=A0A6A6LR09_HEVBR|nr:hypothetical protein GH714_036541 [Hevea brasiliensis]
MYLMYSVGQLKMMQHIRVDRYVGTNEFRVKGTEEHLDIDDPNSKGSSEVDNEGNEPVRGIKLWPESDHPYLEPPQTTTLLGKPKKNRTRGITSGMGIGYGRGIGSSRGIGSGRGNGSSKGIGCDRGSYSGRGIGSSKRNGSGRGSGSDKLMVLECQVKLLLGDQNFLILGGKPVAGANPTNNVQDSGPSTPVPDKKLLLFILDRLQKKDTYGVFSEPVDPNELPDYHEVIEHPMDFGTVRKKLSSGVYTSLEQFEKDIFLICSNAMQYNAPDTIYFRQARSIQELAKKNFENLRQDSDDNEPEPKIVRRGRPPTKNFKKPVGRPSLEHAASAVALDGTLATAGESIIWSNNDLRKGPHVLDKSSLPDSYGRSHGSRNDGHLLTDNKFEKNDEGSMFKGNSMKHRKRQFVLDENRRNTYSQLSAGGREPSVLATFDAERKQLMALIVVASCASGRASVRAWLCKELSSICRKYWHHCLENFFEKNREVFAIWVMFGPGWVGENDIPPQRALLFPSNPQGLPSPSRLRRLPKDSCAVVASCSVELREKLSEKPENNASKNDIPQIHSASEAPQLTNDLSLSASTSAPHAAASKSEPCMEREAAVEGFNSHGVLTSSTATQV